MMPRWTSQRTVQAFQIREILDAAAPSNLPPIAFPISPPKILIPEDPEVEAVQVTAAWYAQYVPQVGGYFVRLAGGIDTYMPASAFLFSYQLIPEAAPPAPTAEERQKVINRLRPHESIDLAELASGAGLDVDTVRRVIDALQPEVRTHEA